MAVFCGMKTSHAAPFLLAVFAACAWGQAKPAKPNHDAFYWLGELNKASTVMVVEQGIVPRDLGAKIATGVARVIEDGDKPGARRPGDYLVYEPLLIAQSGPDVTRMHSGRSRQDILSTTRRVMLRERALDLMNAMSASRDRLIAMAGKNVDTIVPAYTNGVQAQPTTLAHYLLAFAAAYDRHAERMRQAYARLNLSPLGSAALGTSSFPVNRPRLADLLGFDGVAENSYDANQVAPMDIAAELADIASLAALTTGSFVEDIHAQYHQTSPWFLIQEGELTRVSSIMPQKRNPNVLNTLRLQASTVVGGATMYAFQAHNVTPGMPDYKRDQPNKTLDDATEMFSQLTALLDNLVIFRERALAEVNADYSTTTELADVLQREADVAFRIGHHFASELVDFGRKNKLKPGDIAYADAVRIYAEAGKKFGLEGAKLPLTEARFRSSLSPEGMVNSSKGMGGPQPEEVKRMLEAGKKRLADDQAWVALQRSRLMQAQTRLDTAFKQLMP
jgi:argininosuccinate lyase